jgi:hypothetical protein
MNRFFFPRTQATPSPVKYKLAEERNQNCPETENGGNALDIAAAEDLGPEYSDDDYAEVGLTVPGKPKKKAKAATSGIKSSTTGSPRNGTPHPPPQSRIMVDSPYGDESAMVRQVRAASIKTNSNTALNEHYSSDASNGGFSPVSVYGASSERRALFMSKGSNSALNAAFEAANLGVQERPKTPQSVAGWVQSLNMAHQRVFEAAATRKSSRWTRPHLSRLEYRRQPLPLT